MQARTRWNIKAMAHRKRHRQGYSLIETLIAGAVGAVILGLTIASLSKFLDMQRSGQVHLQAHTIVARLAEQFRGDVWAARTATQSSKPAANRNEQASALDLVSENGHRTEYKIVESRVLRTVYQGDEVRSRESFTLPAAPRLDLDDAKPRPHATLSIPLRKPPDVADASHAAHSPRTVRISATLARDRRFAAADETP